MRDGRPGGAAQAVRTVVATVPLSPSARLVIAAKGLEQASGKFLSQVIAEEARSARVFVLSGPSFADDVIRALRWRWRWPDRP